jgi:hypothetical protein
VRILSVECAYAPALTRCRSADKLAARCSDAASLTESHRVQVLCLCAVAAFGELGAANASDAAYLSVAA